MLATARRWPAAASRSGRTRRKATSAIPQSHGATLTDAEGVFRMDMPQIVPAFGQPHGHLAYDAEFDEEGGFETVFLRPVMASARETTLNVDFVLQPV